jgi:hypothetical protein
MRKSVLGLILASAIVAGAAVADEGAAMRPAPPSATASPQDPPGESGGYADPKEEAQRRAATSEAACIACHEKARPELVRAWRESAHAAKGVGCVDCHGRDHSTMFSAKGAVSEATCAGCHKEEGAQFARSGHARAWTTLASSPRFEDEPAGLREATCAACHRVGEKDRLDASVGRCDACHAGHAFSAAEARRPEACATCHAGPEHPQADAFAGSKHGALFAAGAKDAPTCASCHMPRGAHDTSATVTTEAGLSSEKRDERRAAAIAVCAPCHATRFADEALATGDAVRKDGDALLARARALLEGLDKDGLLRPARDRAKPLVLGPGQLEHAGSALERRYFKMWRAYAEDAWKAAYHQAPALARAGGSTPLREGLAWIEDEAARLRKEAKQ